MGPSSNWAYMLGREYPFEFRKELRIYEEIDRRRGWARGWASFYEEFGFAAHFAVAGPGGTHPGAVGEGFSILHPLQGGDFRGNFRLHENKTAPTEKAVTAGNYGRRTGRRRARWSSRTSPLPR